MGAGQEYVLVSLKCNYSEHDAGSAQYPGYISTTYTYLPHPVYVPHLFSSISATRTGLQSTAKNCPRVGREEIGEQAQYSLCKIVSGPAQYQSEWRCMATVCAT